MTTDPSPCCITFDDEGAMHVSGRLTPAACLEKSISHLGRFIMRVENSDTTAGGNYITPHDQDAWILWDECSHLLSSLERMFDLPFTEEEQDSFNQNGIMLTVAESRRSARPLTAIVGQLRWMFLQTGGEWPSTISPDKLDSVRRLRDELELWRPRIERSEHAQVESALQKKNPSGSENPPQVGEVLDDGSNGGVYKPDGWTRSELIGQANHDDGDSKTLSPTTFDRIRRDADIAASERGGVGQQRRYSIAEVRRLIVAAEAVKNSRRIKIADAWRDLLPS